MSEFAASVGCADTLVNPKGEVFFTAFAGFLNGFAHGAAILTKNLKKIFRQADL